MPRARLRAAFFCLLSLALVPAADAQSTRRGLGKRVAPSPALRQYLANLPERDIDLYVGRIVRKDGDIAIVNIMSPSTVRDRTPLYYACDSKMTPTAVLESAGASHRSCAAFKIVSGDALVGDVVMVKYFAPKKEKEARAGK